MKATWLLACALAVVPAYAMAEKASNADAASAASSKPATPAKAAAAVVKPVAIAASTFESPVPPVAACPIDKMIFGRLATAGFQPVLCSDAVFLRRVYLDVIGTLPTAKEAQEFLDDPDGKTKRRRLIDRLLERDELADYWSMKWGDLLRIKAEFPVNLWPNAAQAYHRWVRESIATNKPYDRFVRELLTSSGSNFRVGPVNFYRAIQNRTPEGIASAVALTFLGARTEKWPSERLSGMAVFFSQVGYKPTAEWKEENVFWDPYHASTLTNNVAIGKETLTPPPATTPATATSKISSKSKKPVKPEPQPVVAPPPTPVLPPETAPQTAMFPDGTKVTLTGDRDPREIFAEWLIQPKNRWFARSIVNRTWSWLLGRGIIHEPDDIRDDNPPSHPALLAYLEQEFVAGHYDCKRLFRLILNSNTYQLSSMPHPRGPRAAALFAYYPPRRMDAEVLIDAVNKVTGTSDLYTSAIPEPFTYIPRDKPAIAIADGSITSPFLALFGRSARATGMENERNNKPVPAQWMHLLNSSHIQDKLESGPGVRAILTGTWKREEIVKQLYLTILSRYPTQEEIQTAMEYGSLGVYTPPSNPLKAGKSGKYAGKGSGVSKQSTYMKRRDDWIDVAWALINSTEFLYRH